MDYLRRPREYSEGPVPVPLVATLQYDFKGFRTFPDRHGYRLDGNWHTDQSLSESVDLLQSWLFFGLLAECTGRPVSMSDYQGGDEGVIAEAQLFQTINDWIYNLRDVSSDSPKWANSVMHARETVLFVVEASRHFDYISGMAQPGPAAVAISCKGLATTFLRVFELLEPDIRMADECETLKPWRLTNDLRMPYPALYLQSMMAATGWCPNLIRRICKRQSYVTPIYLMQMDPVDHDAKHDRCTSERCIGYNVDVSS
jgi:hypothetical protein